MNSIYKILFEVKLLHEYYLTGSKGETIFDIGNQSDRLAFVHQRFLVNQENINNDIVFAIPGHLKKSFAGYRMKLIDSYAGFRIGIEVREERLPDGTITYLPVMPLPDDLRIQVLLLKKNILFDQYTNNNLLKPLRTGYYFSNEIITGSRSFPTLSADISSYQLSEKYEQGELVKFGPGSFGQYYMDDTDNEQYIPFSTAGFVNNNDQVLVFPTFYYSFPVTANVTAAELTIKDADNNIIRDSNGNPVTVFQFSDSKPLGKVRLQVDPSLIQSLPSALPHEKLLYQLEVTGNNGYNKKYNFFFASAESEPGNCVGIVSIRLKVPNASYNSIDPDGKLITRRQADATIDPLPPVFEIWFKSRLSFWRYRNNLGKAIQNGIHTDFMLSKDGQLISMVPRPLTYNPGLFRKADNTWHFFPCPERYAGIHIENSKLYSEITVRKSELFPLEP